MGKSGRRHRLRDGRVVQVRVPDPGADLNRLYVFFGALPDGIRNTMRYDLRDREFLRRRLGQIDGAEHWRVIAEVDGRVVGDGTMDREPFAWTRHVAELRCVVDPAFQHLGIGTLIWEALVERAAGAGIERLFTELTAEQRSAMDAVQDAGFVLEAVRARHAKDPDGRLHDVFIFSNDLAMVWKRLEEHVRELDEPAYRSGEY